MTNQVENNHGLSTQPQVVRLGEDAYLVRVTCPNGEVIESKCRVEIKTLATGKVIKNVTFESDAFQREIMLGNIQSRDITQAVIAAHNGTG
jgi:hypothetical protein